MEWLINQAYAFTGDWGLAILIITTVIRTALIPINLKQMTSMYKQQTLNPKIEKIREKYKNNKDRMNKKLMELYKKEGVSFSGCLLGLFSFLCFL